MLSARIRLAVNLGLVAVLVGVAAGCSSSPSSPDNTRTQFEIGYSVTGTCNGSVLTGQQVSIAYTGDGGSTEGLITTLPFSRSITINTTGPITALAIAADCPGNGTVENTITAQVSVDGSVRDTQSATGPDALLVTAATVINTGS